MFWPVIPGMPKDAVVPNWVNDAVSPRNSRGAPTVAPRSPDLKSHWPVTAAGAGLGRPRAKANRRNGARNDFIRYDKQQEVCDGWLRGRTPGDRAFKFSSRGRGNGGLAACDPPGHRCLEQQHQEGADEKPAPEFLTFFQLGCFQALLFLGFLFQVGN